MNKNEIHLLLSSSDLKEFFNWIEDNYDNIDIVAFDVETNGLDKVASTIWGIGVGFSKTLGFYIPIYTPDGQLFFSVEEIKKIKDVLNKVFCDKEIIGHNLVFDVEQWLKFTNVDLSPYIVADTILMQHLLNEEGPFGLKEIAQELLGKDSIRAQEELLENVKSKGGKVTKNQCDYYLADTHILGKYCVWDVLLTCQLYDLFRIKLQEENLMELFETEVMPLYREVTIPMNLHGLRLDLKLLNELLISIVKDINRLELEIFAEIDQYITEFEEQYLFDYFKSVGPTSLIGKKIFEKLFPDKPDKKQLLKNRNNLSPEQQAYCNYYETKNIDYLPKNLVKQTMLECFLESNSNLSRPFNLRSKQHLQWLFFEKLKLNPLSTTEKGSPQVNDEFIDHIANSYSWAKKLQIMNKLEKLRGTYLEGFKERLVGEYIYPSMLQYGTTSGRFASRNPNCQNLPRPVNESESSEDPLVLHYNNQIRKMFIPADNYVFVDADYSALEPRCFAHCSGDKGLQDIYKNGEDFYSSLAIKVFNVTEYSSFKKDENFLGTHRPELRQIMKVVALAAAYGAGAFRIASLLPNNSTVEYAQELLDNYFKAYPKLQNYQNQCHHSAKHLGYVITEFGRKRHLSKCKELYDTYKEHVLDYQLAKKEGIINEYKEMKNYLNNSTNFPIQGLAAHIVNRAMLAMQREFIKHQLDAKIILQIHDQIVVECHKDCAEKVAEIVKNTMENTTKLSVPLIAEPKIGMNLKESH